MIHYHDSGKFKIAEVSFDINEIIGIDDIMDLMAEARMNDSGSLIIHKENLGEEFFDLRTGVAGAILQKFSNYRMKLAIIGSFKKYSSKSLQDFIVESNRTGSILFVDTVEEALNLLKKQVS